MDLYRCKIDVANVCVIDEQNSFRKKRSCSEHIFTVTSLIRNILFAGLDTHAAFIDMEKAFDWVNRKLLFYRLLEFNIDGKLYNAIKTLYTNNISYL